MKIEDLAPIMIASPVQRSGTTLLQRLITSSPDALIYGETCARELNNMVQLYRMNEMQISAQVERKTEDLKAVLSGDVNRWIQDLMPPPSPFLMTLKKGYFTSIQYLKSFAESNDRPIWGVKQAGWHWHFIDSIMHLMPRSKVIYVIRNLEDCVRSAKTAGIVTDLETLDYFCQQYQQQTNLAKYKVNSENLLIITYENLLVNPSVLQDVASFSGVLDINPNVMQARINDFPSEARTTAHLYRQPAVLNEMEIKTIRKYL